MGQGEEVRSSPDQAVTADDADAIVDQTQLSVENFSALVVGVTEVTLPDDAVGVITCTLHDEDEDFGSATQTVGAAATGDNPTISTVTVVGRVSESGDTEIKLGCKVTDDGSGVGYTVDAKIESFKADPYGTQVVDL